MQILLGILLASTMVVIGYYIFKAYKQKHRLAETVRRILIIGQVIVGLNLFALIMESYTVCLWAYSIYFAVSDWLMYYLLKFSLEYIGSEFEKYVNKKILKTLLFADTISVSVNVFTKHLFDVREVHLFGGEIYHELTVTPFFYTHYAIIGFLAVLCLIVLFYKSFTAPYFYRKKYLTVALILVLLVILNVCTYKSATDLSVIGYVIAGIAIYYCSFVYTPQRLLPKTLLLVAKDMTVALFVKDADGKRLYSNTYAEELLDTQNPIVHKSGITLEQWCLQQYMGSVDGFTKEECFFRGDEEMILKIQLQQIMDSNKHLQGGYFVVQDRTEEINNLKRERYQATHDKLTGLYNKLHFYEKAENYVKRHEEEKLLMICTDIKDFKMINDFMGTQTGDMILIKVADVIREQIKEAIVYGRLSNDRFGILMAKKDFDEASFTQKLQTAFLGEMKETVSLPVVIYTGVYEIKNRNLLMSVMCDRARMAIASIKGDYHTRVAYYDNALREQVRHEQEMVGDLEAAIEKEQLKIFLQPQTDETGKVLGAEALIRWLHPVKGYIMPGDFIPVFEKNGLITEVDKYIWEAACKQLKKWKEAGREDLYISVNISLKDFYFLNVHQIFMDLTKKYEIEPKQLKLEITETAVVMDLERQLELVRKLRQSGFIVEMDDFGSGYSSLNMLKDIHVDVLKMDMEFLNMSEDEARSKIILQTMIELAIRLGMTVIAEGIENAEQVRFLSEMGCHMFQGYHFGKPVEVEKFEELYW